MPVQSVPSLNGVSKAPYASFAGKALAAGITITLPAAAEVSGHIYFIKKTDLSVNSVSIVANGAETIDGALEQVLGDQYDVMILQSDGSNWHIMARWQAAFIWSINAAGNLEII